MKMKRLASLLFAGLLLTACATTPQAGRVVERLPSVPVAPAPPPVPALLPADLVRLAKQGLSAEHLIGRIKDSRTRLRLTATEVIALKTDGVPLAVLDYVLESERLAVVDDCTAQINRRDEEARVAQQQAVGQAELMGWQRCQLSYPGMMSPFPVWRPFPYRR